MSWFYLSRERFVGSPFMRTAALGVLIAAATGAVMAQTVPPALESPAAQPPQIGPHGEKIPGMPKFHDPAPYDIDEHTGYKQIFDGKSFTGWDADANIWRVEDGVMVGETLEGASQSVDTSEAGDFAILPTSTQLSI